MVDHDDFVFDVVPENNDLGEVADREPASEYLFARASALPPPAATNEASTS